MMETKMEMTAGRRTLRRSHSMSGLAGVEEDLAEAEAEAVAELRKILEEGETRAEILERETMALQQENAKSEMKARVLERRLLMSKMKEIEEMSKMVRVEESLRLKIDEKEREIGILTEKIEEMEEALRRSEERARCMEWVAIGLREKVKVAERVMGAAAFDGCAGEEEEEEKEAALQWPVMVQGLGLAGAISAAVAAMIYLWFGRQKSFRR